MKIRAFNYELSLTRTDYRQQFLSETKEYALKLLEKARFTLAHQQNLLTYSDQLNEHQIKGIENAIKQAEHDILNYTSQLEVIDGKQELSSTPDTIRKLN